MIKAVVSMVLGIICIAGGFFLALWVLFKIIAREETRE